MCCCNPYTTTRLLPGPDPTRFSFLPTPPPSSVPFPPKRHRFEPIRSSLNGAVSSPDATTTFYDLLGIPETGSFSEIKRAYKQLARKYHPDVSPPDCVEEYTQTFIRVQEAYETLSDPRSRELYDRDVSLGIQLAFSARRRGKFDEQMQEKGEWKSHWQSQVSELKKRSTHKNSDETDMSWGARMRRERNGSSS